MAAISKRMSIALALLAATALWPTSAASAEKPKNAVHVAAGARVARLKQVATFKHQATGVTVTEDGRIFVNFPRWTEDVPVSVAEVLKDGSIKPYPDEAWNAWRNAKASELSPQDHFVCLQSAVADGKGSLWVVDPAAPNSEKIVRNGPKLVQIDLKTNVVKKVIAFPPAVASPASYLNDI